MAGHAQLKFVMTECSKTQIGLTGLIYYHVYPGTIRTHMQFPITIYRSVFNSSPPVVIMLDLHVAKFLNRNLNLSGL